MHLPGFILQAAIRAFQMCDAIHGGHSIDRSAQVKLSWMRRNLRPQRTGFDLCIHLNIASSPRSAYRVAIRRERAEIVREKSNSRSHRPVVQMNLSMLTANRSTALVSLLTLCAALNAH